MRILLYLAALAIFLMIVNIGARWLGDDTDTAAADASAVDAQKLAVTVPSEQTDETSASILEPAAAVAAVDVPSTGAPTAPRSTSLQPGPEPLIGGDQSAKPAAALIRQPAPVISPTVAAETSPAPQAADDDLPGAMSRFADSAQEVAESAVDSVTDTIKTVSAVITGAAAADTQAEAETDAQAVSEAATAPERAPLVEPAIAVAETQSGNPGSRRWAPESVDALLRRHPNKNLVVMFWEPGADSVKASFEWLTRVQTRYGSQQLHTIAVNVAPRGSSARGATAIAHATNVEQRSDPEGILARAFWIQAVPSLYIVKPDGSLHARIDGFDPNRTGSYEDSVRSALRR